MTREEALAKIATLPADLKEDIALVVETAETQGDYCFNGEYSVWEDSVNATLYALAQEIRSL